MNLRSQYDNLTEGNAQLQDDLDELKSYVGKLEIGVGRYDDAVKQIAGALRTMKSRYVQLSEQHARDIKRYQATTSRLLSRTCSPRQMAPRASYSTW